MAENGPSKTTETSNMHSHIYALTNALTSFRGQSDGPTTCNLGRSPFYYNETTSTLCSILQGSDFLFRHEVASGNCKNRNLEPFYQIHSCSIMFCRSCWALLVGDKPDVEGPIPKFLSASLGRDTIVNFYSLMILMVLRPQLRMESKRILGGSWCMEMSSGAPSLRCC